MPTQGTLRVTVPSALLFPRSLSPLVDTLSRQVVYIMKGLDSVRVAQSVTQTRVTYPNWKSNLSRKPKKHRGKQSSPAIDTETQNTSVKRRQFPRYVKCVTMTSVFLLKVVC